MSAATDSLNFAYSLAVERLTTPAGAAAEAIGRVNKVLAASQKLLEKLEERLPKVGERLQSFSQAANTGFLRAELAATRFTATTQKIEGVLSRIKDAAGGTGSALAQMTSRAERAVRSANAAPDNRRRYEIWWEQQAARMEKAEQKKTAALEREAAKRARLAEQEQKAQETAAAKAQKAAERAAKQAAAAEERAYKKSTMGRLLDGHRSFGGLLGDRATDKGAGLVSGAADMILGAPGTIVGAIGSAAGAAWDLAKAGAEGAFSFARMAISAQALREQSVEGFKSIYGSESTAERLFSEAVKIAKTTKFDTPEVVEVFNALAAGGFKENELEGRFGGYSDVASARGTGYGRRYLTAIQKLNAQPNAMFASFQQGAMAGPGLKLAEEVLAKQLGISGGNIDAKLRQMFRDKKISGSQALAGLEGAVSQRYDQGGTLGTYAKNVGMGTWEGLISNIRNGLSDVLTMKLAPDHPMNKLKDILKVVNSLFDDANPRAQRFNKIVSEYLADVFSVFDIGDGKAEKTVESLLKMLEDFRPKFKKGMEFVRNQILDLIETLNKDGEIVTKLKNIGIDIGIAVGKGVLAGIKVGLWDIATPDDSMLSATWKDFKGLLGVGDQVSAAVNQQIAVASTSSSGATPPRVQYGDVTLKFELPESPGPSDYVSRLVMAFEGLNRNPK